MVDVLLFFLLFLGTFIFIPIWFTHKNIERQLNNAKNIPFQLLLKKEKVKTENSVGGYTKTNRTFLFKYADLYFYENAFIIAGYKSFFGIKLYQHIIILTLSEQQYQNYFPYETTITLPKRFNPNSFNGDVYIEFNNLKITAHYSIIRLKGLSNEEKEKISYLRTTKREI